MFRRLLPAALLVVLTPVTIGCDAPSDGTPRNGDDSIGGKADGAGSPAGLSCPANVYVTHAANDANDHVYSNCHNAKNGRFVNKACCAEDMDLIEDISGCPSQVRFTDVEEAADKRCMNDVAGHDGYGEFVPTACCAPLCDTGAAFDLAGTCRDSAGQFEDEICCHRAFRLTEANCNGARWEAIEGGTREFACRAPNGQFTFDSCCAEECAEVISRTATVPESCNLDALLSDECPAGSTPNAGGICHDPVNGQFVKAVCCELSGDVDDLDEAASDECWAGMASQAECA